MQLREYKLQMLEPEPALELFRRMTGMSAPPDGMAELEREIVAACAGVPLVLRFAGGKLWQEEQAAAWQVGSVRLRV